MFLKIISAVLLFTAIFELPYGYYEFLRIAIFIGMAFLLFAERESKPELQLILYAGIGILFNPFIPIHLERNIWFYLDISISVLLMLLVVREFIIKRKHSI